MSEPAPLPFFRYASTVGIQSSLLLFAALFLPRTSLLYFGSANEFPFAQPASSLDRPQSPFIEPLTASPVLTLAWICAGVAAIALWWATWMRKWAYADYRHTSTKDEFELRTEKMEWQKRASSELSNAIVATVFGSSLFYILILTFGAPLASHHLQTYLLALNLSLLTVFPSAYVLGTPAFLAIFAESKNPLTVRLTWTRLFAELSPKTAIERALLYPVVGTMLGCWLGSVPIGLDWDRPWQPTALSQGTFWPQF